MLLLLLQMVLMALVAIGIYLTVTLVVGWWVWPALFVLAFFSIPKRRGLPPTDMTTIREELAMQEAQDKHRIDRGY